jgi:hypothetical protein
MKYEVVTTDVLYTYVRFLRAKLFFGSVAISTCHSQEEVY